MPWIKQDFKDVSRTTNLPHCCGFGSFSAHHAEPSVLAPPAETDANLARISKISGKVNIARYFSRMVFDACKVNDPPAISCMSDNISRLAQRLYHWPSIDTALSWWCLTAFFINTYNAQIMLYKPWSSTCFFKLNIIWGILGSSFSFIWIPMIWVYGHYNLFHFYSAIIISTSTIFWLPSKMDNPLDPTL